jgi:pantetheine-phosphate adenylyltransferase
MADVSLQPIASKLVKEIALFGGEIARFVSPAVRDQVLERVGQLGRLGEY